MIQRMKKKELGKCGMGGSDDRCGVLDTNNALMCLFALHRTDCGALSFRDRRCYLHNTALADFNVVACDGKDVYWEKAWNKAANQTSFWRRPYKYVVKVNSSKKCLSQALQYVRSFVEERLE
eukprot:gene817-1593_t